MTLRLGLSIREQYSTKQSVVLPHIVSSRRSREHFTGQQEDVAPDTYPSLAPDPMPRVSLDARTRT